MKYIRTTCLMILCVLFSCAHADETASSTYQFKGDHFLASYLDCDKAALTDLKNLHQVMLDAAAASGATVLNFSSWEFPENGFTMVILLSESHASIHTYPEFGACFVDLFTCGENCSAEYFDKVLRAYLKPEVVAEKMFIRSDEIIEKHALQK